MRPVSEGGYGPEKGKRVFYASENSGRITGVTAKDALKAGWRKKKGKK